MNDGPQQQQPKRRRIRPLLLFLLLVALIAFVVSRPGLHRDIRQSARAVIAHHLPWSPRDLYALRLRIAGLDESALGTRWRTAVARAGKQPVRVTEAYQTRAGFAVDGAMARVYMLSLQRGQRLEWRLARTDESDSQLFASLEHRQPEGDWDTLAWLEADGRIHHKSIDSNGDYRIVLQPELFAGPSYRLAIARGGSLPFPVDGASQRDIGSVFGDPRDNGSREHHGVDIFADRGTPVHAVADGRVRTGDSGIGGKHVWLASGMLGIGGARYYYAHLDTIAVDSNDRVAAGDVLGRVGNTGNARTTPPHLHFGLYTATGPLDPAPFIRPPPQLPDAP